MHAFIEHARSFSARAAVAGERLDRLAAGQNPLALFITCSDSRVVPALITSARPGELFELRTAGGIVPRYSLDRPSGEAATIEFAIEALGIGDVVVCGHSHCAAVGAVVHRNDLAAVPAMGGWLAHAADSLGDEKTDLALATQQHVLTQLERLHAYPAVQRRLLDGRVRLHGWFYEVHTGKVFTHRPGDNAFLPL
ncbi:carbonic anhydrase [Streptosporangium carneum]|uniref:carbonic anhydrase n=1 Tax=Streptosporangium carneum TaxID=47481 RepID=A0A9W6I7R7_9ACTN|nr:carbonic anhydrase [Streptosporangium carneum]GLK12734.1 carbonic anhydrase [Streptosporangium carneum]